MSDGQSGCFAWCISFKKSCNERVSKNYKKIRILNLPFYVRRMTILFYSLLHICIIVFFSIVYDVYKHFIAELY